MDHHLRLSLCVDTGVHSSQSLVGPGGPSWAGLCAGWHEPRTCHPGTSNCLRGFLVEKGEANLMTHFMGFPGGSAGKESACNMGVLCSIPGLGRSPGEGNSYSLQYSGLENSMDYSMGLQRVGYY